MIARMTGRAPLLLAAVLFGAGVTGLAISTAERTEWGPFQPRSQAPVPRVVVVDVRPEITPPPLLELLTGYPAEVAVETAAQVQAPAPAPASESAEAEPTPVPPLRVYGIASNDAGVSAAGATATPPPPIRIINIASDVEPGPAPGGTPAEQSEQQPQSGCDGAGCPGSAAPGSGESAPPSLLAGNSGREIAGNAFGLQRRAEAGDDSLPGEDRANRGRAAR